MSQQGVLVRLPDAAPPQDLDAEQSVLGAVFLSDRLLEPLHTEVGLRPEHFYREQHADVYSAMLALEQAGTGVDTLTVKAELQRRGRFDSVGQAQLDTLAGAVPAVGNARAYGERVVELARWRARIRSALDQLEACAVLDEQAYDAAQVPTDALELAAGHGLPDPIEQLLEFMNWYDATSTDSILTPFDQLNDILRLRPGDTTAIAGWTSMGKSVLVDQILEHAATFGDKRCALYINEMALVDRIGRLMAGRSNVSFSRLMDKKLNPDEIGRLVRTADRGLRFQLIPCSGWSAPDIARHIRRHKWDMAAVDLATQIPARETSDWYAISRELVQAARQSGCHTLIVVQLNRSRNDKLLRPPPNLRDLLHAGAWEQDNRNVVFVHRAEEEHDGVAELLPDGLIMVAKQSNGPLGQVPVTLNPRTMRFEPLANYINPLA